MTDNLTFFVSFGSSAVSFEAQKVNISKTVMGLAKNTRDIQSLGHVR